MHSRATWSFCLTVVSLLSLVFGSGAGVSGVSTPATAPGVAPVVCCGGGCCAVAPPIGEKPPLPPPPQAVVARASALAVPMKKVRRSSRVALLSSSLNACVICRKYANKQFCKVRATCPDSSTRRNR